MNILSLFDGMSCGRLALERAGIHVDKYYASEIDKYSIATSKKNYPNIVQLGDITKFDDGVWFGSTKVICINPEPDLIIGGSPCQGFSFAGKQLAFDDPRSRLFFKFVEILNYYKPKYFLLENVRMKKEHQDIITKYLGVEPICINSSLVSAQNRVRYYWTNIPGVTQPEDRRIEMVDILETQGTGWIKSHGTYQPRPNKAIFIDANYHKGDDNHGQRTLILDGLADNIKGFESRRRVYSPSGKCPTLLAQSGGQSEPKVSMNSNEYRKLTPIECERLQTLPDNYTEGVSNTQRYKMLGNGWTVDVVSHIFKELL